MVQTNSSYLLDHALEDSRNLLITDSNQTAAIFKAIDDLSDVSRSALNKKEADKNISNIISAINKVRKITADASTLRQSLDELLGIWEKKWYL